MTVDAHPPAVIGPDHQLPPHVPAARARPRWPRRALPWLLLFAAAAVVGAAVVVARRSAASRHAPATAPPVPVTTATARRADLGVYQLAIGTVTPVYTSWITSQVTGMVVAVHYAEGQTVQKGDALVDIDPRPLHATLMQAEGVLERDEHLLAQARMDLERYRAAWARNAIARQQLEDQEKLVQQDLGTVKNDRGAVEYDRVQLGFCHITAPISGRVGLRLVDPGNVVQANAGTTLAVITQVQPITVVFALAEEQLAAVRTRLRQGARLPVDALDRTGQQPIARGTLLTLDNQIDTTTGTVKARAVFDNADDALFPNQFVNARLLVDTLRDVTVLPASAIQQRASGSFVYVIQDGVAHARDVKPGVTDAGTTQVDGIAPGDVVADSNFERLRDGTRIAVAAAAPGPPGAPAP